MGEWISVNDKLPKEHQSVICTDGKDVAELIHMISRYSEQTEQDMRWRKKERHYFEDDSGNELNKPITHWMPLPKPPEI